MGSGTSSGRTRTRGRSSGNANNLADVYQRAASPTIRREVTQAKWQAASSTSGGGLERLGGSEEFNIPGIGMARVTNEVDRFGTRGFIARIAGVNDDIYPVNGGRAFDNPRDAKRYAKQALAIRASRGYF